MLFKVVFCFIVFLSISCSYSNSNTLLSFSQTKTIELAQNSNVLISTEKKNIFGRIGKEQGSGVLFFRNNQTYVLTAAHVLSYDISKVRIGNQYYNFKTYNNPDIIKNIIFNGKVISTIHANSLVLKVDETKDLALLKVDNKFLKTNVILDCDLPPLGSPVYVFGNMFRETLSNSLSNGITSYYGRTENHVTVDQLVCTIVEGDSGCGVYLQNNSHLIGIIVSGITEHETSVCFYVPSRVIKNWSIEKGFEFIFNKDLPIKEIKPENIVLDSIEEIPATQPSTKPSTQSLSLK